MKKILFIAPYPDNETIKDGMMQRIKAIDMEFESIERVYLEIRIKNWLVFPRIKCEGKVKAIEINLLFHFWLAIFYLLRYNNIYIHSVANAHRIDWARCFLKHKNIILDVHGSVPEEMLFNGKDKLAPTLEKVEKHFFKMSSIIIYVSQQMKNFYLQKYPFTADKTTLIKPIYSTNVLCNSTVNSQNALRKELDIDTNTTVFIYAGNLQKWQNFDLMLETIAQIDRKSYHYIILTGEPQPAAKKVEENGLPSERITIRSVHPTELNTYYDIAHYGFILRDEHILNQVAAPTKMVEYLYFGLTPIVKFEQVGDAYLLNYDYLNVTSNLTDLRPEKSMKNKEISNRLLHASSDNNIFEIADKLFS